MHKVLTRIVMPLAVAGYALTSCSDDDNSTFTPTPPSLSVNVSEVQRTYVNFAIQSATGVDYAYQVVPLGQPAPTAEEIFANGKSGILENGAATIKAIDVEGGNEYTVYAAVRKINPYVYSDVVSTEVNTDIPFTNIVTLDKVGYTDFTYHVEMPADCEKLKHVVIKKADYEGIKSILAMFGEVTYPTYLKVFGKTITESQNVTLDKYDVNGLNDDIHIYSGSTYLIMAGAVNADGNIDESRFECVEFDTRRADVAPYKIDVAITTTSTSATAVITPDPEFVTYRALIEKRSEFDFAKNEGEAQVRSLIIGRWDDETNTPKRVYNGTTQIVSSGLIPNTDYVLGIVGFDAQNREKVMTINFVTGEPTGPAPTINITQTTPETAAPWKSAAFNVKLTNAVEVRYGFFLKSSIDNTLLGGASLSAIIQNNGMYASDDQLAGMLTNDGVTFETNDLQPSTEYVFGIYARNDEYVSACETINFTTDELPQIGGETRQNMPGKYMASTTDVNGNTVTFPVTITTGVNDATTADYSAKNRLVALGFGPADQFPYKSPEQLVSEGKSAEDANKLYGPKWFIGFTEDGIIVPKPTDLNWAMGNFGNSKDAYMWGIGVRPSTGRDADNLQDFPVEVSEDGNTVTIKPYYLASINVNYYPTMVEASSAWFFSTVLFRSYSDIVLTRQNDSNANIAKVFKAPLKAPKITHVTTGNVSIKNERKEMAQRIQHN